MCRLVFKGLEREKSPKTTQLIFEWVLARAEVNLSPPNLQDFTLDMYFRQFWQDPRLSFEKREGLEKLVVGAEYINLIWVPDTFFVNEKTAYFHKATTENQFLRILHTGEILRSIRYLHFFAQAKAIAGCYGMVHYGF